MVDFDNETTVATPAKDVMKIYLLQCKAYLEDCWRMYRKDDYAGINSNLNTVRAALEQLYIVIERIIFRHWPNDNSVSTKKEDILNIIATGKSEALLKLIIDINIVLDKTRLTRLDTKAANKSTWEASNLQHGY